MIRTRCWVGGWVMLLVWGGMACNEGGSGDDPQPVEIRAEPGCDPLIPEVCALPFPSDFFAQEDAGSETGLRLDYGPETLPANIDGVHVDPAQLNRFDGFSPASQILMHFAGGVDASALPPETDLEASLAANATTILLDLETGERVLHFAELERRTDDPADQLVFIRPMELLLWQHRYAVGVRNLQHPDGSAIDPSAAFAAYRDNVPFAAAESEARRPELDAAIGGIVSAGWAREELLLAFSFTVGSAKSLTGELIDLADDAYAVVDAEGPIQWTVNEVIEPVDESIATRIYGRLRLPLYLTSNFEGAEVRPGGRLMRDESGRIVQNGWSEQVPVLINIPHSVADRMLEGRFLTYGHGLVQSVEECNRPEHTTLAEEYGLVYVCTDLWGLAAADEGLLGSTVLPDFSNFHLIIERLHQGQLNQMLLSEFIIGTLQTDPGFASAGHRIDNMAPEVYFYGNSQGGIMGPVSVALDRHIARGVFGVPGAAYSYMIPRSTDVVDLDTVLSIFYPSQIDWELNVAIVQMLWDGVEFSGFAEHLVDPLPGRPAKTALFQPAWGDVQNDPKTINLVARSIDLPQLAPAPRPIVGVREVEAPYPDSVMAYYDPELEVRPIGNRYAEEDRGTHEAVRRSGPARRQIDTFLMPNGAAEQFCQGICDDADCYPY